MTRRNSLRTELLTTLAVLAAAALSLGIASVVMLYNTVDPERAPVYISLLVGADVFVVVAFAAYQVERIVLRPLREATNTAEAIAGGDLERRLPGGETKEMHLLATSFNRMTDRLLEERAHLVRAEKLASVGRLAAGIAHEIGNPLGAINGYVHVLATSPAGGDRARDAVAGLERESSRIDRIVRGLLDYARPSTRATGPVEMNATARGVLELLAGQGVLKRVDLHFSPSAEAVHVVGDRHHFEQVLVNLVLNAVDAMDGAGRLSLILRRTSRSEMLAGARRAGDAEEAPRNLPNARAMRWLESSVSDAILMIAVTDSGPGIPAGDADRVFDPFYTTKEPGKGTGLGLAIVARGVENAGGAIWVTPSREGGAAFRMLLPLAPVADRVSTPARGAPSGGTREVAGS